MTTKFKDGLERSLTAKERKAIPLEDFAWPEERKFPIDSQDHLDSAATLIGHAPEDKQASIKERAISIAKRKGFSLPASWQDKEERSMPLENILYYAPIERIDKERREIIGTATAEVKDAHGTIIGYEASKDAFARWAGNIREMHDPKKAVGRALEITPDDEGKRIIVRAKISKGAEDTWQKILDGTLSGFSIGGRNGKWAERIIDGEKIPYLERYDQSELSIVDNPSCPVANVSIVRADGAVADDVLADEDEEPVERNEEPDETPESEPSEQPIERAGARLSKETQDAMHLARDHAKSAMSQTCTTCGCDDCNDHISALNQIGMNDDNDGDVDANYMTEATRAAIADVVRAEVAAAVKAEISRALSPSIQRVEALLARDAQLGTGKDDVEITRRVDDLSKAVNDILGLVKKIHDQPTEGGPVLHGQSLAFDKSLATRPGATHRSMADSDAIARAMELGFAPPSDTDSSIRAAAALISRR